MRKIIAFTFTFTFTFTFVFSVHLHAFFEKMHVQDTGDLTQIAYELEDKNYIIINLPNETKLGEKVMFSYRVDHLGSDDAKAKNGNLKKVLKKLEKKYSINIGGTRLQFPKSGNINKRETGVERHATLTTSCFEDNPIAEVDLILEQTPRTPNRTSLCYSGIFANCNYSDKIFVDVVVDTNASCRNKPKLGLDVVVKKKKKEVKGSKYRFGLEKDAVSTPPDVFTTRAVDYNPSVLIIDGPANSVTTQVTVDGENKKPIAGKLSKLIFLGGLGAGLHDIFVRSDRGNFAPKKRVLRGQLDITNDDMKVGEDSEVVFYVEGFDPETPAQQFLLVNKTPQIAQLIGGNELEISVSGANVDNNGVFKWTGVIKALQVGRIEIEINPIERSGDPQPIIMECDDDHPDVIDCGEEPYPGGECMLWDDDGAIYWDPQTKRYYCDTSLEPGDPPPNTNTN